MVRWFQLAHQADLGPKLFINNYSILSGVGNDPAHQNNYDSTIQFLIAHKAPLGGIGMQSHFGETPTGAEKLWTVLDRFGRFNLSIESTEFDIKSIDRAYQAAYLKDFMTALFDSSWEIKPNGQAWIDLVTKDWWTNASGISANGGSYKVRGFMGDYAVTATLNGE